MNISENVNPNISSDPEQFRFEIGASHKMIHSGVNSVNLMRNPVSLAVSLGQGEFGRYQFRITQGRFQHIHVYNKHQAHLYILFPKQNSI